MTDIEQLLQDVSKCNYISLLDCSSGFWQIEVAEDSKPCTAFITHRGLYHWNVLSFGLRNASATFQKTMNVVLNDHKKYASSYIDDTAVHSVTFEDHLAHLDAVLTTFESVGLTLKLSKCVFCKNSLKYVGHVIGSGTIAADEDKINAILNIAVPTTKKLIRSFTGMANYYRRYIPNLSTLLIPLTELCKKDAPKTVVVTQRLVDAVNCIKQALCSTRVLRSACFEKDFYVQTDASKVAVGACLSQLDDEGDDYPIAFASCKLSTAQQNWSTVEREAFAIIFALKRFDHWLFGSKVIVVSDHNPLSYLLNCVPKSSKLMRWALALQRYNIVVKHRPGRLHGNCDALSRL
jgi:RNase H-like domain found in reverse transcriptase/Reverse transcriptase (RNA-dependent DNA polymerase)